MKKFLRLSAAAVLACVLMTGVATAAEKVMRIGSYMPIVTMVPWKTTSNGDHYIIRQIYSTLLDLGANSQFIPDLAKSWECADDGVTWTVHLRDDMYWHTGNGLFGDEKVKVTADDVKASYDYYLDPANGSARYSLLSKSLKEIKVIDDFTIQFVTKEIDVLWENSMMQNYIVPRKGLEQGWDFGANPVGCGAYKYLESVTDASYTLVKNEDYFREPALDKIIFKFISDKTVSAIALQNKELDLVVSVLPTDVDNLLAKDYIVVAPSAVGSLRWISVNCKKEPFTDPQLRRALAMAINMDGAIAAIFGEQKVKQAVRAYGCIPYERPGGDIESNKAVTPQYNPKEAARLLDELGWKKGKDGIRAKDGKKLKFTVQVGNNDSNREKLSVIVATQFRALGIDATAHTAEWGTHTTDIKKGNVEMYIIGGYNGLDGGKQIMETNPLTMSPNCGYSNPEVDALISEAFRTIDYEKRCDLLRRAANIFSYEAVHIGSYFEYMPMAHSTSVTDFDYPELTGVGLCSPTRNVGLAD